MARVGTSGDLQRFNVGGHPGAIAAGRRGIWVAGSAAAPVARFDLVTGASLATASVPASPVALALDTGTAPPGRPMRAERSPI